MGKTYRRNGSKDDKRIKNIKERSDQKEIKQKRLNDYLDNYNFSNNERKESGKNKFKK